MSFKHIFWLLLGPACLVLTFLTHPPFGLSDAGWWITGLMLWMVCWWVTEIIPIPVTSLLPMLIVPLLGADKLEAVTTPYAHPIIFLFLGGFFISIAMEKSGLHLRIALRALTLVGQEPRLQIAILMFVTAFLSMWMSNTATAVMMLPIGLSLMKMADVQGQDDFGKAILLAIAYSASIGGVATLIGTPPNALLAAYLDKTYQIQISFADWMLLGVPLALVMLVFCWFWLCYCHFKLPKLASKPADLHHKLEQLGSLRTSEKSVLLVFILAALGWINQQWLAKTTGLPINDTLIALSAVLALFILPGDKKYEALLRWQDSQALPWGILLLFGGGLTMAGQIQKHGIADLLAQKLQLLQGIEPLLILLAVTALIIFLTEVTSNTATAAAFLPLLGPVAVSMQLSPLYLVVPAALAASFAFMLPVATPPNAIVFASGQLKIKDMAKAGLAMNLIGLCAITGAAILLAPLLI